VSWEITDPEGGVLIVGTPAQTIMETRAARDRLDALLDQYRQIEGREAVTALDSAINEYTAMRELQVLAKFLTAFQSATGGWAGE
jgi:hypothetical protein